MISSLSGLDILLMICFIALKFPQFLFWFMLTGRRCLLLLLEGLVRFGDYYVVIHSTACISSYIHTDMYIDST